MSIVIKSPHEVAASITQRVRAKRLRFNWTQETLANRAGVSYGTLKRFEQTGQIALASLLKLASALNILEDFEALLAEEAAPASLDTLLRRKPRKRGTQ